MQLGNIVFCYIFQLDKCLLYKSISLITVACLPLQPKMNLCTVVKAHRIPRRACFRLITKPKSILWSTVPRTPGPSKDAESPPIIVALKVFHQLRSAGTKLADVSFYQSNYVSIIPQREVCKYVARCKSFPLSEAHFLALT